MNNQEAAEIIRSDMKLHHDFLSGEYRKALSMAISALESEWEEMIVICDNCGHTIHVKRRTSDGQSGSKRNTGES